MSTTFPTSKQTLSSTRGSAGQPLNSPNHVTHHTNEDDTIEALQDKVGADGSAVTTSHDYKLGEVTGSDKAVGKTATQTLTNKTLTSPKINVGSDATGDLLYRDSGGSLVRLAIGVAGQILQVVAGVPSWVTNPTIANTPTSDEKAALVGTSGTPSSTNKYVTADDVSSAAVSGKIVRANGTALPALDGSALTGIAPIPIYKNGVTTKNAADASTTQNIAHGLGKTPKYVRITAMAYAGSGTLALNAVTVYNGTTQSSTSYYVDSGTTVALINTFTLNVSGAGGGPHTTVGVVTFDGTNISIAWTKTNSPTGTYNLLWEAFA